MYIKNPAFPCVPPAFQQRERRVMVRFRVQIVQSLQGTPEILRLRTTTPTIRHYFWRSRPSVAGWRFSLSHIPSCQNCQSARPTESRPVKGVSRSFRFSFFLLLWSAPDRRRRFVAKCVCAVAAENSQRVSSKTLARSAPLPSPARDAVDAGHMSASDKAPRARPTDRIIVL